MPSPCPPVQNRRLFLSNSVRLVAAACAVQSLGLRGGESTPPLACGQIGTSHPHAAGKMQALQNLPLLWRVAGVCEPDPARKSSLGASAVYGTIPLLEEDALLGLHAVRAVSVETDLRDGTATALRAIRAGKHVHLDKPGGVDHAEFATMRREAQQSGLCLQMGYMLRYNPAFELLQTAVKEGWLGEITEIDSSMGKLLDARSLALLDQQPGGAMLEIGCHLIDMIVTLLGKPSSVQAFTTPTRNGSFSDNQLAVLTYPKATACVRTNFSDPFGNPRRRFNVTGTEGSFEILPLESGRFTLSLSRERPDYRKGTQSLQLNVPKGRYDAEFVDLARVVRGEKNLPWDAAHDIAVHETTLRAAGLWKPG